MTYGRTSFAFKGGGVWFWYERDGTNVPIAEIRAHAESISRDEGPDAARDFMAMIRVKLKRAEQGQLIEPQEGRPYLARQPGMMEVKWSIEQRLWRLYYCEPPRLHEQRGMLGLYFNEKLSKKQQDCDIDEAARRWHWWQVSQRG